MTLINNERRTVKKQETRAAYIIIRLHVAHGRALIHRFSRTGGDAASCRRCCPVPICPSIHGEHVATQNRCPCALAQISISFLKTLSNRSCRVIILTIVARNREEILHQDFRIPRPVKVFVYDANNRRINKSPCCRGISTHFTGKATNRREIVQSSIFRLDKILVKFPTT